MSPSEASQMRAVFDPHQVSASGARTSDGRYACPVDFAVQAQGGTASSVLYLGTLKIVFLDQSNVPTQTNTADPLDWFDANQLTFNQRLLAHRVINGPNPPIRSLVILSYGPVGVVPSNVDTLVLVCS